MVNMDRKGISPLISAVLLVAVTISVAAVFSGWAPQIATTITGETENDTLHQLDCEKTDVEIVSAHWDSGNSEINTTIRNRGRENLPNLILAGFDSNDQLLEQNTGFEIKKGNLSSETLSVSTKPSYLEVYSQKCGSTTHKLEDISG